MKLQSKDKLPKQIKRWIKKAGLKFRWKHENLHSDNLSLIGYGFYWRIIPHSKLICRSCPIPEFDRWSNSEDCEVDLSVTEKDFVTTIDKLKNVKRDNESKFNYSSTGNSWTEFSFQRIDIEGNVIKRSKWDYPYTYDSFTTFVIKSLTEKINGSCYSDRMYQGDYKLYNMCCREVWGNEGQNFYSRQPKDIEKFLSLYMQKPIQLVRIKEHCNQSNGYPYWSFEYISSGVE